MNRSIFSGSASRLLVLLAGLVVACGDDGSTTATESTTNATTTATASATATMTATEGTGPGTTAEAPTTTGGTDSASATESMTSASSDTAGAGGYCAHQCMQDSDCLAMGMDLGLTCQDNTCTGESSGCTNNEECVALYSGWTMPCSSGGGECDALMQVCVTTPEGGLCATPPSDFFMCDTVPGWAELTVPDIDGNQVTVCGNPNAECNDDSICVVPCKSDADCVSEAYPVCDTNTGICNCGSDDHCATLGQPNASVCNNGACGCNADQQCVDGKVGDTCTAEGYCGCSGDAACAEVPNSYDGGTIACVKP